MIKSGIIKFAKYFHKKMIMNYFYCDDYSEFYKRIYSPHDKSTAKKLHKNKEIYLAIFVHLYNPKFK